MTIRDLKERLTDMILAKSFKYSEDPPFTLASGRTSNYYFNCKPTTLDPEGMNLIGEILFDMLSGADITAAGGLTLGADPIANALSVISWQKGKPIRRRRALLGLSTIRVGCPGPGASRTEIAPERRLPCSETRAV